MTAHAGTSGHVAGTKQESVALIGLLGFLYTEPVRGYAPYTGIGSRQTPDDVKALMGEIANWIAHLGWTLRSGCAPGADSAFEEGAMRHVDVRLPELYLPWPSFQGGRDLAARREAQSEAFDIAAHYHPRWHQLKPGAKMLHARNVHLVLGFDVTMPVMSKFVICWTPEAKRGGGTGQALRIAEDLRIPIYDLAEPIDRGCWEAALKERL